MEKVVLIRFGQFSPLQLLFGLN